MADVVLLDGGMGQELIHRTGDRPTPIWSTQVMLDHPGLVAEIHRDFFAAGATIATANTYAVHKDRLIKTDYADDQMTLLDAACREANTAKAKFPSGRIAGAIGPLGASYRPDIHPARDIAVPLYAEIARRIAPSCDLMICETVVSYDHIHSVLEGASAANLPVWLAVSVDDKDGTKLRSGEPVAGVMDLAVAGGAEAVLVNCSSPEAITTAMPIIAKGTLPFGGYANGFEQISSGFLEEAPTVDALTARRDFSPAAYAEHALGWVDQGATIVGGCCEVSPAHIQVLAEELTKAGYRII